MDWKNLAREVVGRCARVVPQNWLEPFLYSQNKLSRVAYLGLIQRDLTVKYGLASGVKFNAGAYNPDTSLGTYEMPVQEILSQYLEPGSIFYDIGANVGFFTILGAKIVNSSGKVYAFEPEAKNAATLRRNAKQNNFDNVTVIEKAVSKTTGEEKLWLREYCGSHSLASDDSEFTLKATNGRELSSNNIPQQAESVPSFLKIKECVTVDTVAIDDLLQQQQIEPPTLVKIDVEGAEINVLQGMSQTLKKYHPIIIYEVDDENQEGLLSKRQQVDDFLLFHGYEIKPLAESYREISWNVGHAIAIPA
jgi:FkbM family methyltransferase